MKHFFSKLSSYIIVIPIAFFILIAIIAGLLFMPYASLAGNVYSVFLPNNFVVPTPPPITSTIVPNVTIAPVVPGQTPIPQEVKLSTITFPKYQQYYANLECADIGLSVKVFWGDTNAVLHQGIGQSISSFYPGFGKPLLMGGHNKSFLSSLANIKAGDVFKLTTSYGEFEYTVVGVKIMAAKDFNMNDIAQDKEVLMLYTCYPFNAFGINAKRYIVYAEKTAGVVIVD